MLTACQKCGDCGFVDALTYCSVCRVTAEHRYCFDILPKVLNEDAIWVQEDCSSSVCESSSPVSSSHTPDVNDEKQCVKAQIVQSKHKRLLRRTQSLQAEKVCRTFEPSDICSSGQ